MDNKVKQKIRSGGSTLGTFIEIGHMNGIEALENTGLDFVIIDGEHGDADTETITDLIRAAELAGLTPLVRICEVSRREIQRVLDSGAQGLIVPGLKNLEEVKKLVQLAKFAPLGNRGFCPTRVSGWGAKAWAKVPMQRYMEIANENVLVIPQCETKELLENIEDVMAVEGVDGTFIGPVDLSIALGVPGDFEHPELLEACDRIREAARSQGKLLMMYTGSPVQAGQLLRQGYDGVALGLDTATLNSAYRSLVEEARGVR